MEEIGRFKRTINPYKNKKIIIQKTTTAKEKLQHAIDNTNTKIISAGTKFRGAQDKLRKTFPGVETFNKRLEDEYNKKDLKKKNWWEY